MHILLQYTAVRLDLAEKRTHFCGYIPF